MSNSRENELIEVIRQLGDAFTEYEDSIRSAQKQHHNYEEWNDEQWGPINDAEDRFWSVYYTVRKDYV